MDENNNDERTLGDKAREWSQKIVNFSKWVKKHYKEILIGLGILLAIILCAGFVLAGQQLIMNVFNSILGIFGSDREDIVEMNKITIAAQQVHDAEMTWDYIDDNENTRLAKIKQNIVNALNQTENPGTNCSTYVACVLYKAGCFTEQELNAYNYISPNGVEGLLIDSEWPKITKKEYLRPGDIVFMGEGVGKSVHVQIYAGGNKWYNAGTVLDIQDIAPKDKGNWSAGYDTWWAYRCPDLLEMYPIPQELITINPLTGEYQTNVQDYAEQILAELETQKVNNDVIGFNTEELGNMIEKYIRAEIKTSNIKTDHPLNEEDGLIVIKRASIETGTVIDLQYIPYARFCERVDKQDEIKLQPGEKPILQCFSLNPETFDLCIAKMNDSVTYYYFTGAVSVEGGGISMEEINYKKYIENNITPLNFFIVLHLLSEDSEFMDDLVSLALGEGKINPLELTYVDSMYETKIRYDYQGDSECVCETCGKLHDHPGSISNSNIVDWWSGVGFHTKTTKRYKYKLYVSNADTWLVSTSKSISQNVQATESINEGSFAYKATVNKSGCSHSVVIGTDPKTGKVITDEHGSTEVGEIEEKITTSTLTLEFTVVDKEKQIKVDDFVELIKQYPRVENNFTTAPSNIFYLLRQDESTLWHERVMRYVLYKLTDIDYGVLDGELDGILRDGLNQIGNGGGDILAAAKKVHDAQMHWTYYEDFSQLKGDIDQALNNPNEVTCCSTYVSSVLYVAGFFTKEEMETPVLGNIGFNSPIWVDEKLKAAGWEKITDASKLEAGDVVLMDKKGDANPDHVQIYAGDNTWYNAGYTGAIQSPAPYEDTSWEQGINSWWAYRPPNNDPSSITVIPGNLLEAAQKLHDAQRDWQYTTDYKRKYGNGGLVYKDIEKSLNNPKKATCCSTYVSQVLYIAGYFTEDEMNAIGYNYQVELNKLLKRSGWEKITDSSQLQAGDIVFLDKSGDEHNPNHVQIYAGNDTWYNAGNTTDIQGTAPVKRTNWVSYGGWDKWWAYRPPVLEEESK